MNKEIAKVCLNGIDGNKVIGEIIFKDGSNEMWSSDLELVEFDGVGDFKSFDAFITADNQKVFKELKKDLNYKLN